MSTPIPARDLRNNYGQIIERVRRGERLTVVTGGVPVVDLIPHAGGHAPPRFRPANDRPRWAPISAQEATDWAADIRGAGDSIDQTPSDPWERR